MAGAGPHREAVGGMLPTWSYPIGYPASFGGIRPQHAGADPGFLKGAYYKTVVYTKSVGHYHKMHGTSFEKKSNMDRLNFFFGTSNI